MKAIGKSSLSSVLKVALDVVWVVVIAALVVFAVVTTYSFANGGTGGARISIPVILEVHDDAYSIAGRDNGAPARLECLHGELNVRDPDPRFVVFFGFYVAIVAAVALVVLYQLRKIFATLTAGSPFVSSNAARIRLIGWLVIAGELVEQTFKALGHRIVMSSFDTVGVSFKWDVDLGLTTLLWGFVLLVLAEVFRLGVQMREDQELTV